MKRVERIAYYENLLGRCEDAAKKLDEALFEYKLAQSSFKKLDRYYRSKLWRSDFEADEAGKIPHSLKRGVLSEDLVYNVLEENDRLKAEMKKIK